MMIFAVLGGEKTKPIQSQTKPNKANLIYPPDLHWDLKKQSQFSGWRNDVRLVMAMVYGVFYVQRRRKTKPIQSQFHEFAPCPEGSARKNPTSYLVGLVKIILPISTLCLETSFE